MSNVRMVEVMALVNLPASCLNRDEANLPKECNFGGVDRNRVSTQAQKYAMRQSEDFKAICDDIGTSIRTARVDGFILPRINGMPEEFIPAFEFLCDSLGKETSKDAVKWDEKSDTYDFSDIPKKLPKFEKRSKQIMIFSESQINFLVDTIQRFVDEADGDIMKFAAFTNKNIFERMAAGNDGKGIDATTLDTALFGSMTASAFSTSVPASMHLAQMFSIDSLVRENDFYIAADDYNAYNPGQQGAANLGDIAYNCSCMYKYAAIDVDILRENLKTVENVDEVIKKIIPELVKNFVLTLPKGKQNSNAAYVLPDMVCVNIKEKKIACNYANAFVVPVKPEGNKSIVSKGIEKFVAEVDKIDKFYGLETIDCLFMNCVDDSIPNSATKVENLSEMMKIVGENL